MWICAVKARLNFQKNLAFQLQTIKKKQKGNKTNTALDVCKYVFISITRSEDEVQQQMLDK